MSFAGVETLNLDGDLPPAKYISAVMEGDQYTADQVAAPYDPATVDHNGLAGQPISVDVSIDRPPAPYEHRPTGTYSRSYPTPGDGVQSAEISMPHPTWEATSYHFPVVLGFDLPGNESSDPVVVDLTSEDVMRLANRDIPADLLSKTAVMKITLDGHTFDDACPYALDIEDGSVDPKKLCKSSLMKTCDGMHEIGHPLIHGAAGAVLYARDTGISQDDRQFSLLTIQDLLKGVVEIDYGNGNMSYGYPKNKLPYLKWLFEVKNKVVDNFENNPAYRDHHDEGFYRLPPPLHHAFVDAWTRKLSQNPCNDLSRIRATVRPLGPTGSAEKKRAFVFATISAQLPTDVSSETIVTAPTGATDMYN